MNELNDDLLNEYLDGTLDAETRQAVETQLARDPAAQARLAELQNLFADLAQMGEAPLTTDLSAPVLAAIRAEKAEAAAWWLRWLPLLQLVVAGLLIGVFWVTLRELWDNGRTALANVIPTIQLPDLMLAELVASWLTAVGRTMAEFTPQINLATSQWIVLVGMALVMWLLGNRLLFSNRVGGSHG